MKYVPTPTGGSDWGTFRYTGKYSRLVILFIDGVVKDMFSYYCFDC